MDLDIIIIYENGMFDRRRFNNMVMIQFFYFYIILYVYHYQHIRSKELLK